MKEHEIIKEKQNLVIEHKKMDQKLNKLEINQAKKRRWDKNNEMYEKKRSRWNSTPITPKYIDNSNEISSNLTPRTTPDIQTPTNSRWDETPKLEKWGKTPNPIKKIIQNSNPIIKSGLDSWGK